MKSISALELLYLYQKDDCLIIDVRNRLEYTRKHIPKSFNIPLAILLKQCILYLNKDFTYYIICKKGQQSKTACISLDNKGYKVVNVMDGIEGWEGPIESERMFNH